MKAYALTRDEHGQIVKTPMDSLCGVPATTWNYLAERILKDAADGKYYPLDPLDVYQEVALKLVATANDMPELETAAPETYLGNAVRFAFFDVWKAVGGERLNQKGVLDNPPMSELADLDAELVPLDARDAHHPAQGTPRIAPASQLASLGGYKRQAPSTKHPYFPQGDHNYAPLYKAVAALERYSSRGYKAVCAYLNPETDGNLQACAAAAGIKRSKFYATFWPETLEILRRLIEGGVE